MRNVLRAAFFEVTTMRRQKRAAIIQDLSGFGRCSMTVALPLISAAGIQCCPVPTALLSNHTGYPSFYFSDFTEQMPAYIDEWRKMNLEFDGIYAGFLGSKEQIGIVEAFIRDFKREGTRVILDPVMGDQGEAYATYTPQMCREMKRLVRLADILTPNVTEACILTDRAYRAEGWSRRELQAMAEELAGQGAERIVITGIEQGAYVSNYLYERGGQSGFVRRKKAAVSRPGTGDVFASLVAAGSINGEPFRKTVEHAADFVKKCLIRSEELEIPRNDGVCFELFMNCR